MFPEETYDNGDGTLTLVFGDGTVRIVDARTYSVLSEGTLEDFFDVGQDAAPIPPVAPSPVAQPMAPPPAPVPASQLPNPYDSSGMVRSSPNASYAQNAPYGFGGSPGGTIPYYQDGTTHPFFGGPQRQPGGFWNQSPNPASPSSRNMPALPYSPARSPGSYGASGGSSGGGGGGGSALYQAWRDKLTSKLFPGSGSGYSSYGSTYGGGGGKSVYTTYEYPEEKMKGKYAKKVDPTQAQSVMARPTMMLPQVAPKLDSRSPMYEQISAMPLAQMATIMSSRKKVKLPEYPTTTYLPNGKVRQDPGSGGNVGSRTVNALGRYINQVANKEDVPTFDQVANQLMGTKKKSLLGMSVANQPAGYGLNTLQSAMDAAFSETLDPRSAAAYSGEAAAIIDQIGARAMRRRVGRGNPAKRVARRLF